MVKSMKPGSVIVDLAVEQGGNCELAEFAQIAVKHGVSIIGHANMPSLIASDASALYARNLLAYLTPLVDKETKKLTLNEDDEIVKASLIAKGGALVHPSLVKPAA
jgi:NAD(P) transhydrogenase subunit alpha